MSFHMTAGFWKDFSREIWGKQPRVFKQAFGGRLLASPEELFRMASEETAHFARVAGTRGRMDCRFAIEMGTLMGDQWRYMPRQEDGSFAGWAERSRRLTGGRGFCYHMNSVQRRSSTVFERYREFTDGLFAQVGLPSWRADSDIFAGDYAETPFGIHKDMVSNFAFIALGRKRMLLWPYETLLHYVHEGVDVSAQDFSLQVSGIKEIREKAIVLEGEPGDVFYWPGHFWHCAEGTGELSVTNNLAIDVTGTPLAESFPSALFESVFPHVMEEHPLTPYEPERRQELAEALPERVRGVTQRVVRELKALVEGGLEREMELSWLRYVSGGGFGRVPPPATDVVLDEARAMKLAPMSGLVWRKLASGELACSANGLVSCHPESRGLVETLQRLSGGGAHRVGALLDEAREERRGEEVVWSRERMKELLTTLAAQRALVPA